MTWRKNTTEEIEELRHFVDGMKRGQTLPTSDSLLETLRQIHDRREAPISGHDHRQMLKERLCREMAVRQGRPVEDPVPVPQFVAPPARRRVLEWAVAASILVHVGIGVAVLPNVEFDARLLALAQPEESVEIIDLRTNPFFAPPVANRRPTRVAPVSAREASTLAEGQGRVEGVDAGVNGTPSAPGLPSRPPSPPVAPGTQPVIFNYASGVEQLADSNLPEAADPLPDGPQQRPEKIRAMSEVKPMSVERVGPIADSFDVAPKVLMTPRPMYPPAALRREIEGSVRLSVLLSADGSVREIQVVRSDDSSLDDAAMEAARRIKFMPATRNGSPVSVRMRVEVSFSLP